MNVPKFCFWSTIILVLAGSVQADEPKPGGEAALGEKLFHDTRFSSTAGDMHTGCASCHAPADPQGERAFTELLARSWHPWRFEDPGRETLRNTPTLLDVADFELFHYDGEFSSLEDQAAKTLRGRNFGWLPEEREEAGAHIARVVRNDSGPTAYPVQFRHVYGVDVDDAPPEQIIDGMARALAAYMTTLRTPRDSAYDEFLQRNELDDEPGPGESARSYGARLLDEVERRKEGERLELPASFDESAFAGFRIFFRTSGSASVGNCVTCHTPPNFTDGLFHNTGVSQFEYDGEHGKGSFAELEIPNRGAVDGSYARYLSIVDKRNPEHVDLGFWNFARADSPMRRGNETEEEFFSRVVAAFKTPTLRNLVYTEPYMHNGEFPTLVEAIEQKVWGGEQARRGGLRNPDPELSAIRLDARDIDALAAFLRALTSRDLDSSAGGSRVISDRGY